MPFAGVLAKQYVHRPEFKKTYEGIPILRQLEYDGTLVDGIELPFPLEEGVAMYQTMLKLTVYDQIMYDIQRQGRISFYMTNSGEEAAQVGSSAALDLGDVIFPQYRELGVLMWRGFTLQDIVDQCFSLKGDPGKGRQMPVHYTSKKLNIQTISSPLATQIPHATGCGYAFRMRRQKNCAVTYFGEGAASEGDFIPAINFAATLKSQTLFICRNNGFAISTPVSEQYIGDGIAVRGIAYGINTIRVDGNDIVASYNATKEARRLCLEEEAPCVVELMTYRVGHHSTSDDASRYRQDEEAKAWQEEGMSGVGRFKRFLINQGVWSQEQDMKLAQETKKQAIQAIREGDKEKYCPIDEGLFEDVYDTPDWRLREQQAHLHKHLETHADKYDMSRYEPSAAFPFPADSKPKK